MKNYSVSSTKATKIIVNAFTEVLLSTNKDISFEIERKNFQTIITIQKYEFTLTVYIYTTKIAYQLRIKTLTTREKTARITYYDTDFPTDSTVFYKIVKRDFKNLLSKLICLSFDDEANYAIAVYPKKLLAPMVYTETPKAVPEDKASDM